MSCAHRRLLHAHCALRLYGQLSLRRVPCDAGRSDARAFAVVALVAAFHALLLLPQLPLRVVVVLVYPHLQVLLEL